MISLSEYLMGRIKERELPNPLMKNAAQLLISVNEMLKDINMIGKVRSGYRDSKTNAECGGSKMSKHMLCAAIDLEDNDQKISLHLAQNQHILEEHNLYMEHPSATPTWCHLQIIAPKSGKRIFYP